MLYRHDLLDIKNIFKKYIKNKKTDQKQQKLPEVINIFANFYDFSLRSQEQENWRKSLWMIELVKKRKYFLRSLCE